MWFSFQLKTIPLLLTQIRLVRATKRPLKKVKKLIFILANEADNNAY